MNELHSLLKQQLQQFTGESKPTLQGQSDLVRTINDTYWQFDADRTMLERNAMEAATAREQAEAKIAQHTENMATLNAISQTALTTFELDAMFVEIYIAARKLTSCDSFTIVLLDEENPEIVNSYIWDEGKRYPPRRDAVSASLAEYIIRSGKSLRINQWDEARARIISAPPLSNTEKSPRSVIAIPLPSGTGGYIGMISVQSYRSDAFTAEHEQLLFSLTNQTAKAIENARLYASLEVRVAQRTKDLDITNQRLASLLSTALVINSTLNQEEVLDQILKQTRRLIPCRAINIMLIKGEHTYIVRRIGYEGLEQIERNLLGFQFPLSWPTFKKMIASGRSVLKLDTTNDPEWQNLQSSEWVKSYVGIPLKSGGEILGFLNASHHEPNFFTKDIITVLEGIAQHASIGIKNANLLTKLRESLDNEQAMRAQLVQADKLSALGKMVAVIAHEINNPIQTVKNSLFLLQDQIKPGDPSEEYLTLASMEVNRISDLVAQLRDTYRPGSKAFTRLNVFNLLVEVKQVLAPQLEKAKIICALSEPVRSYEVFGASDRLKQVFMNICLNAIEAIESQDGGAITINLRASPEGQRVGVEVRNTGPQIPATDLPHLFEPFFTKRQGGSGLGLSISYDIVRQHRGEINVENLPEKGVAFTIWLPLVSRGENI